MKLSSSFVLLVVVMSGAVCAQTSQISGVVRDATGSSIPGVSVKATQAATGVVRTATSGIDGGYVLTNLPIGPYMQITSDITGNNALTREDYRVVQLAMKFIF